VVRRLAPLLLAALALSASGCARGGDAVVLEVDELELTADELRAEVQDLQDTPALVALIQQENNAVLPPVEGIFSQDLVSLVLTIHVVDLAFDRTLPEAGLDPATFDPDGDEVSVLDDVVRLLQESGVTPAAPADFDFYANYYAKVFAVQEAGLIEPMIETLRSLDVWVDPKFGSWDTDQAPAVLPPPGPITTTTVPAEFPLEG
jgi:hypothetical protein